MTKKERVWCNNFLIYIENISKHPNYHGLPIKRKKDGSLAWIVFTNGDVGKARKKWAEKKAFELGFPLQPGVYARVMREIHPTKFHVCQICGSNMSIFYYYPSINFLKLIKNRFNLEFSICDHIGYIWDQLLDNGANDDTLRNFFKSVFKLPDVNGKEKSEVLEMCEKQCRENGKSFLSPGTMSNFPDRFDGFHTYNRCCRAAQDKGRSRENLKSYTKDRRAYEYWSDGNIHAANTFIGGKYFIGKSADHIGPISLGFVHDPCYLRPMLNSDNSTKRDRLLIEDIEAILEVEESTGVYPMSWYSADISDFIKSNYKKNPNFVSSHYRDILKQNIVNFMFILNELLKLSLGKIFLFEEFILPKYECFLYSYELDDLGRIIKQLSRRFTERNNKEIIRFTRIAFESVKTFNEKNNRNIMHNLTSDEKLELSNLCKNITMVRNQKNNQFLYAAEPEEDSFDVLNTGKKYDFKKCLEQLKMLVITIEKRLIKTVISELAR